MTIRNELRAMRRVVSPLRRCVTWGLLAMGLGACQATDRGPTAGLGQDVNLSLAASVVAAPGAVVEAIATYTPSGQAPVTVARDSIIVDTGNPAGPLQLQADVAACLAAAGPGNPCSLTLTIRLKRGGVVLDEATRVVSVAEGATEVSVATVSLFEVSTVRVSTTVPADFEPGDSVQLLATAVDRAGTAVPARNVVWSVVGSAASVSSTGLVRAVAQGAATVRATIGGRVLDVPVTVLGPSVASITILPLDTTVFVGSSVTYAVSPRSRTGAPIARAVTFSSLTPTVASVNSNGTATTLLPGQTTIRVQSNEGRGGAVISATATLRVNPLIIAATPTTLSFETEIGQPLPPAQNVAITSFNGGNVGTLSVQTPLDTLLTATLNTSTAPATLTVRPSRALAPGTSLTRSVVVRSNNAAATPATITVAITGRTPAIPLGRFSGLVLNAATGLPLAQASVIVRNTASVQVDQTLTASDGRWTSLPLPSGTYNVTVTSPGFVNGVLNNQSLVGGPSVPITTLATLPLVPANTGTISGGVQSAITGNAVVGATVELRTGSGNTVGAPLATTTTNSDGGYEFTFRPFGTYTILVRQSGFADLNVTVILATANVTAPAVFLSPVGANVVVRIVLSWGSSPSDLDAHLTGPGLNGRFQVYWDSPGSLTTFPFALLDIDDVDGIGPETISIAALAPGVYRYYVNNFSAESPLRSSNARVDVYQSGVLTRQFFPPQQDGTVWTVFELSAATITPIGTIGNVQPPVAPGPRQASVSVDRSNEWYLLSPWTWRKITPGSTRR